MSEVYPYSLRRGYPHHHREYRAKWRYIADDGSVRIRSVYLVTVPLYPARKPTKAQTISFRRQIAAMVESQRRELGLAPTPKPRLVEDLPLAVALERFAVYCHTAFRPRVARLYLAAATDLCGYCKTESARRAVATAQIQQRHVAGWRIARAGYYGRHTIRQAARGVQAFCNWLLAGEHTRSVLVVIPPSVSKAMKRQ